MVAALRAELEEVRAQHATALQSLADSEEALAVAKRNALQRPAPLQRQQTKGSVMWGSIISKKVIVGTGAAAAPAAAAPPAAAPAPPPSKFDAFVELATARKLERASQGLEASNVFIEELYEQASASRTTPHESPSPLAPRPSPFAPRRRENGGPSPATPAECPSASAACRRSARGSRRRGGPPS